jgi:hypothetical protein
VWHVLHHVWNSRTKISNCKGSLQNLRKLKRKFISLLLRLVFPKQMVLAGVAANCPHSCSDGAQSKYGQCCRLPSMLHRAGRPSQRLVFWRYPVSIAAGTPTTLTGLTTVFLSSYKQIPGYRLKLGYRRFLRIAWHQIYQSYRHSMLCSLTRWEHSYWNDERRRFKSSGTRRHVHCYIVIGNTMKNKAASSSETSETV